MSSNKLAGSSSIADRSSASDSRTCMPPLPAVLTDEHCKLIESFHTLRSPVPPVLSSTRCERILPVRRLDPTRAAIVSHRCQSTSRIRRCLHSSALETRTRERNAGGQRRTNVAMEGGGT